MQNALLRLIAVFLCAGGLCLAQEPLRVLCTQPDLADFAERIGGRSVQVESLTRGHEDLHLVRIKPSQLILARRAELFVQIGLDAEHAWVPALLDTSRNLRIRPGQPGFLNCEGIVDPLQAFSERSRTQAVDLHRRGNPHYNSDPVSMRKVAKVICEKLCALRPAETADFQKAHAALEKKIDESLTRWREKLAPHKGQGFIDGHNAWLYFAETFELEVVGHLEPGPGMRPTPGHLAKLAEIARARKVRLLVPRVSEQAAAESLAADIGAKVAVLQLSSDRGMKDGWFGWMEAVVDTFARDLSPKN